jgi:hypothetical protein
MCSVFCTTMVQQALNRGAHNRNRTGDLFLTKEVLYRLSYVGGKQTGDILLLDLNPKLASVKWSG